MQLLFYGVGATNTYDKLGHLARTEPMVGSCASFVKHVSPGCSANFSNTGLAADLAGATPAQRSHAARLARTATAHVKTWQTGTIKGLLDYLLGGSR